MDLFWSYRLDRLIWIQVGRYIVKSYLNFMSTIRSIYILLLGSDVTYRYVPILAWKWKLYIPKNTHMTRCMKLHQWPVTHPYHFKNMSKLSAPNSYYLNDWSSRAYSIYFRNIKLGNILNLLQWLWARELVISCTLQIFVNKWVKATLTRTHYHNCPFV